MKIESYDIKKFIISSNISDERLIVTTNHPFILEGIAIVMCTKGNAILKINFKEYHAAENMIVIVMPNFIVEFSKQSDDFEYEYLIFSFDFLSEILPITWFDVSQKIMNQPCILITNEEKDVILDYHSFIVRQYHRSAYPYREVLARSFLNGLLAEIAAIYILHQEGDNVNTAQKSDLVSRFFQLLTQHCKQERSVAFYANKLCLTPKYLSTAVKRITGETVLFWITEGVIVITKVHLKATNQTVSQISEELNFPNPSFLGRFFKKHTGMTPLQYRESV